MRSASCSPSASGSESECSALEGIPINEVWIRYKQSGSEAIRNWLVERYLGLVRYLAERQHARLPAQVDVNDLVQAGCFGLLDAIEAFDPARGIKFETFCPPRIVGAVIDYLRSIDDFTRNRRQRKQKLSRARQAFFARFGRQPGEEELLDALGGDRREAIRTLKQVGAGRILSLDGRPAGGDSDRGDSGIDLVADKAQADPLQEAQKADLRDFITRRLTRVQRLIVILHYYERMSMKEVGATIGLSESRISQMLALIVARMKSHLAGRDHEFLVD